MQKRNLLFVVGIGLLSSTLIAGYSAAQDVTIHNNGNTVTIKQSGANGSKTVTVRSQGAKTTIKKAGASSSGQNVTINGNNQQRTLTANGATLEINGNNNHLLVRGSLRALTINGNNNFIEAARVGMISAPGNNNKVTWGSGMGSARPDVSSLGNGNNITQMKK